MSQHKALPDNWELMQEWAEPNTEFREANADCLLELRDRIAALEAAANLRQQAEDADRAMADPAPAIAWARQLPVHDSCPPGGCDICQRNWPCARLVAEQDAKAKSKAADAKKIVSAPTYFQALLDGITREVCTAREAAANLQQQDEDADRAMAPAPAGELVGRVAGAIADSDPGYSKEARAAILAVAEWLGDRDGFMNAGCIAARWLREEVERG